MSNEPCDGEPFMKNPKRERGYIPPHRHCIVCGKEILIDRRFCSKECEGGWLERQRREKQYRLIWIALMVGLFIVFFIILPLMRKP